MKDDNKDKYSEEIQDIVDRMPTEWTFRVAIALIVLVLSLVTLSFIIKYPDTIRGEITVTAEAAPVRVVAMSSGCLHLLKENHTDVKEGEHLAYIGSSTNYEEFKALKKICDQGLATGHKEEYPELLQIGQLSNAYNTFKMAYSQYWKMKENETYNQVRKALLIQAEADERIADNLKTSIALNEKDLGISEEKLTNDSILWSKGALSKEQYLSTKSKHLQQMQNTQNMESNSLAKLSDVKRTQVEIAKTYIKESDDLKELYHELIARYSDLTNQTQLWEEAHLIKAPMSGNLEYLGFLKDEDYVTADRELLSISPANSHRKGELKIPSYGAGKIEVGQEVNVKLNDYPYEEYGMIKGKVASISRLSKKEETKEGVIDVYLVGVAFNRQLITNYGKQIALNLDAKGTADIVTKKKRLIQRLFDNLKAKTDK